MRKREVFFEKQEGKKNTWNLSIEMKWEKSIYKIVLSLFRLEDPPDGPLDQSPPIPPPKKNTQHAVDIAALKKNTPS